MHSVGIELTKLILVGTRITYQATGDAGAMPPRKYSGVVGYVEVTHSCHMAHEGMVLQQQ